MLYHNKIGIATQPGGGFSSGWNICMQFFRSSGLSLFVEQVACRFPPQQFSWVVVYPPFGLCHLLLCHLVKIGPLWEETADKLQVAQEEDKALNAYYRKHKTVKGFPGISDEEADRADKELSEMREAIRRPVPAWQLSNRNGEIKRIKDRLAQLRKVDEMEHTEIEFDGGTIITNEDVNRVQILFDEKPDDATRSKLKTYGFRWSPREHAWQTQRTPQALRRACYILGIDPPKPAPAQTVNSDDTQDAVPQDEPASTDATGEIQTAADGQSLFPLV